MMYGYRKTDLFDYVYGVTRKVIFAFPRSIFIYIFAFVVTSGFIVHAKQDNLQVQNYAPPSETIQQIVTTKTVLETVFHFLKEMNSENL